MNKEAFDDLIGRTFSYKAQLRDARKALDTIVGNYVAAHPEVDYRKLASMFYISAAKLCVIARRYGQKRTPGRQKRKRESIDSSKGRLRTAPTTKAPLDLSHPIADHRDREQTMRTLDDRIIKRLRDEAGEIAYNSLKRWLNDRPRSKVQRVRAQELIDRYEALRSYDTP